MSFRFLSTVIISFTFGVLLAGGYLNPAIDEIKNFEYHAYLEDFFRNGEKKDSLGDEETSFIPDNFFANAYSFIFLKESIGEKIGKDNIIKLTDVPDDFIHAVIAVEDKNFFTHHGFVLSSIIRAMIVNLEYGEIKEGASTITQQTAKNLFFSEEQTWSRKLGELLFALNMEARCSKDEILSYYLSTVYFGSGYYGITDAAKGYFNKTPIELNLAEKAMLAGVLNAPSIYSPYENFLLAKERQCTVLDAMVKAGYISSLMAQKAKIFPIYLRDED